MRRILVGAVAALTLAAPAVAVIAAAGPAIAAPGADPAVPRAAALADAARRAPALATALRLGAREKLITRDVIVDADGSRHLRYQRSYAGLKVIGGDLVIHQSPTGALRSVDRASRAALTLDSVTPDITAATAADRAAATISGRSRVQRATPTLVVWAVSGAPVLAWDTLVTGVATDQTPTQAHLVTDARTGRLISRWDDIHTGTGESIYNGTVALDTTWTGSLYQLKDAGRGGQQTSDLNGGTSGTGTLFTDADDLWGDGTTASRQSAAVDAQYGAAQTWDYYLTVHGRTGIRGDGVGAPSRVHYGSAYVNAFWSDSCFCMTYGDGAGNARPLTSLDVAGHEMSHGVTSNTAGLIYSGESGGLNEATSDIFGTAVEFHAANAADPGDYLIGEKINIRGDGKPLRYQDKPSRDGSSADCWYDGISGLDVHYSSGPANHFFYLLSEGSGAKTINGVAYDSPTCDGSTVAGIGRDKAEQIWYRALTVYMTSTTDYAAARVATLSATADLYGTDSAEYKAVGAAWTAVSVGPPPPPPTGPYFENGTDVSIPDAGAAVTSSIDVTGLEGNAPADLAVTVDIRHTWRGDLVIDLLAPDGTSYRLKGSNISDSADNVNTIYFVDASSEPANGTWQLRVQDVFSADTGYLNLWGLTF